MTTKFQAANDGRGHSYQVFMLVLCMFALGTLAIDRLFRPGPDVIKILQYVDLVVCVIFLGDFSYSLATAPNRWRYLLTWGWVDLLSSIPTIDMLRVGRLARIMRVFRVLRGVKAARVISSALLERRAESAFLAATLVTLVLLVISSVAILHFEDVSESNIKGPEDAIWWSFVTMTTVGYGDRFPVTSEGRVVGAFLMAAGVGLFGAFSGFITSWFLAPKAAQNRSEIELLRVEISVLRALLERQGQQSAPGRSTE